MMIRRKFYLSMSMNEALEIISKNKIKVSLLEPNKTIKFSKYLSVASLYKRNIFLYCVSGSITNIQENLCVDYKIYPHFSALIAAIVLGFSLLHPIIHIAVQPAALVCIAISVVLNIIFYTLVLSQMYACKESFELLLKKRGQGDGSLS